MTRRVSNAAAILVAGVFALSACAPTSPGGATGAPTATGTSSSTSRPTSTSPSDTTTTGTTSGTTTTGTSTTSPRPTATPKPTATPPKPKPTGPKPTTPPPLSDSSTMKQGDSGPAVLRMQQKLSDLGYWLGTPDGDFGYLTSQAVMALQKTAGLGRDGVYGPATKAALDAGTRPKLVVSGDAVQVNLATQVLTVVEKGAIVAILNTSTGSGQNYVSQGVTKTAITPRGTFRVIFEVNGNDVGPLGTLYRSKYFVGGIAVHGYTSVPAVPASHGCARVSNQAMDMIWARNLMPMGRTVVVF